jgi:molybdopterin-binding protein
MNRLRGHITDVITEGGLSLVEISVGSDVLTAMLVETPESADYLHTGNTVSVLFKETEVSLGKELSGGLSLRNRLAATIKTIRLGALLAEVDLEYAGHRLVSIVTRRAVERMQLTEGDEVEALIKANEVMLGTLADEL